MINSRLLLVVAILFNPAIVMPQDNIWRDANLAAKGSDQKASSHYFDADDQALRSKLSLAPNELRGQTDTILLPMPDGRLDRFSIVESSIMEDVLAEEFPQIKSYKVHGIDDPIASGRVDISPKGFRGMLMTRQGRVFIDPAGGAANRYISRLAGSSSRSGQPFHCEAHGEENSHASAPAFSRNETANRIPGSLLSYRLAVSATAEYVGAVGGTLTLAMAEINTAINRVNQVYERDLGVRLVLVANNSALIEVPPNDFGFTNNDGFLLLSENQTWVDATIGSANYDIGHVFSTGGGGVATFRSVCNATRKARGVTGLPNPTGDPFYIDFVAHEIGHQFGANHSFNGSTGSCNSNRNASTAYEPGSGSSIMAYVGICGAENIATASDATFHAGSLIEMNAFISGAGACGVNNPITPANSDPTNVNAGVDTTIPHGTPFILNGSALDNDGDTLTYQWDQMDSGTVATTAATLGTDQGNNPLFRSYIPQPTARRFFPALGTLIGAPQFDTLGETAPTQARTLNFRLTARDGNSGQATDDIAVTIAASSGPFSVSAPNGGAITANTQTSVSWAVNGTDMAPVSCANVDIELLTFSADGSTYGVTDLLSPTPNDGAEDVAIPDMNSAKARISISCSDNIFYDISDSDLTITGGSGQFPTTGNSTNISTTTTFNTIVTNPPPPPDNSGGGGGAFNRQTVLLLLSLLLLVNLSGVFKQRKRNGLINPLPRSRSEG